MDANSLSVLAATSQSPLADLGGDFFCEFCERHRRQFFVVAVADGDGAVLHFLRPEDEHVAHPVEPGDADFRTDLFGSASVMGAGSSATVETKSSDRVSESNESPA